MQKGGFPTFFLYQKLLFVWLALFRVGIGLAASLQNGAVAAVA